MLIGREAELAVIEQLLDRARSGHSQVLLLRGEPGVGKSVLLDAAAERAHEMRILRACGVEAEIDLPFAGLHQLLWPVAGRIDRLPQAQAMALRGALGLSGEPGSIFLVGGALLTLLTDLAQEQPALVLIDDAQWLDDLSGAALGFAARRLEAGRVAGVIAVREETAHPFNPPGMPELDVHGLEQEAAEHLMDASGRHIVPQVRRRLIEETGANPQALKELPLTLSTGQLAGRAPLPERLPLSAHLLRGYAERVRQLTSGAQRLLLLVAAADSLDLRSLVAAAERFEAGDDLAPAETAGLVTVQDGVVRFRHPLVRSAVYQAATYGARMAAHRAIADALTGEANGDLRIWHLAAAAMGPDETIAAALEDAAGRAESRGRPASAATLERAAALTVHDGERARRLVRAAGANLAGGMRDRAQALLAEAEPLATEPGVRSNIIFTRARFLASLSTDIATLTDGAALVERSDPELAAGMLGLAALVGLHSRDWSTAVELGQRLLGVDVPDSNLCKRWGREMIGVLEPGCAVRYRSPEPACEWLEQKCPRPQVWPPSQIAEVAGEEAAAYRFYELALAAMRAKGEISDVVALLVSLGHCEDLLGRWSSSISHNTEALSLSRQAGNDLYAVMSLTRLAKIAGLRGRAAECLELTDEAELMESPSWPVAGCSGWVRGLLDLGLGRLDSAFERLASLAPLATWPDRNLYALRATGDLAEAAIRSGRTKESTRVLDGFERWAGPEPHAWTQVVLHRCRGMLARDPAIAEAHFRTALALPGGETRPFEHARAALLYGEWLRRQKRKSEARAPLRTALDIFDRLGAEPWSERARNELRATGETIRRHDLTAIHQLTPQELHIARLAAEGMTNAEIGAQLFLSPRTVATHLYRIFPKLGIASRVELREIDLRDGALQATG